MRIEHTKKWIESVVIGLNLCPFAKHPYQNNKIHFAEIDSNEDETILNAIATEMLFLAKTEATEIETSILIAPQLTDFEEYLDFLDIANVIVEELELEGIIQVASFHPDYQFAETDPKDVENYTNRAPYPMFHFLRENSVEKALLAFPEAKNVPERNIQTMRKLGHEGIQELLESIK
jgi:hypothetical protein